MYCVVLVTSKDLDEASAISRKLLEQKLIACSNIVNGVNSFFSWKGDIVNEKEVLLVLKTKEEHLKVLTREVKRIHSYETPEIIALPIIYGDQDYLKWMEEVL
ncbi:MAG: cytochrome C biogenesis protein CcdA [Omnitrophica WOR_2 bacterium GWF2_38_59]|nr:MAG: cytochrome C biogenesis protein CcdA [Omnitrophica WOR_2 bacterium GWA2_37_7]OGX22950.1 MAG: cytochrome C biogenesis protein CcdA [Omnitrophica WOR_2 bacterium GWF2_38_59]OGX49739.1 MAG: cytochrome C biogenesis protein CcdA [Omnitrophica WOR_2 bacterium RIFOXYA2_FULL_38_17]OGX54669.1 MAG: cytochrome C biogenesis protein CcdA [Omnitrophica WOR_2 bacterium RIFOXYA12_FULL_38_10]OGX55673.1 MAG: cytochrome C biogenesis protein CcdA [Omnitrophica WOR_2 bacterium RIFOXYC2_FULL_38_12]OGX60117.